MYSHELIKALKEDGFGLRRKHFFNNIDEIKGVEFIYYDKENKCFELKGWGSACGNETDRLIDIIKNPDKWEIAGTIQEKQWIAENEL